MTRIIDLSHDIHPDMPLYPGMEAPIMEKALTIPEHGFEERRLTIFSHTGTHVDAPAHMLSGAATLSDLPLESFLGPACVLDVRGHDPINIPHLEPYGPTLERCAFAILRTGWAERWHSPDYFHDYPALTPDAARWLTNFPLRGLGVDAISVDRHDTSDYPVHHTFFTNNLIVIENLCNLDDLADSIFLFSALPLKLPGGDGSPVRAVALLA